MFLTFADQYRYWFEYEKDSHAKVLASLRAVPADLRSSAAFQKAVDLVAHIIAARWLWLFRFGVAAERPPLIPTGVPFEELPPRLQEMESAWTGYLAHLDDAELARQFEYESLRGGWYRSRIQDVLIQVFGHSWYHRGQIAALVRSLGCEPTPTDLLLWNRERVTKS